MAKKTMSINLSEKSIDDAIRQLKDYQNSLQGKCDRLVEELSKLGQEVAVQHISESPIGKTVTVRVNKTPEQMGCKAVLIATGQTITSENREPFYTLLAIEFGAGIFYNSKENPKAPELGFGVGTYPGQIHAFDDGWYYWNDKTQKWQYTHGIKATMPMYNAEQEIIKQYVSIARRVFGGK